MVVPGSTGSCEANHVEAREFAMLSRITWAAVLAGVLSGAVLSGAQAQQPVSPAPQAATPSGWTFDVAPYLWMAGLDSKLKFDVPTARGATVTTNSAIDFGQLMSHLNSAVMFAADARYDRFSILTDFMYMNLGGTGARFRTVNFVNQQSVPISGPMQTHVGLNLNSEIWTLAGGYTVVQGDWGRLDAIAGFRFFALNTRLNYNLSAVLTDPSGSGTFGGNGGFVTSSIDLWNGIGGFRGRLRLGNSGLFIPYYFDAGAGASKLTWQIASGLGYHMGWGDVSLTYRYLTFEQNSSATLQRQSIYGPMIMANFTF
jgi:hypothetical protein